MIERRPHSGAEPLGDAEAAGLFAPLLSHASGILVGVSGGPDSMALLGLLAAWADCPPLAAATVDHRLRAEAADEARQVAAGCKVLGIPHAILRWDGDKPTTGLQEAARDARYALLVQHARKLGFSHIVTAHHADDQAETVLMRLLAGSGIGGLSGMRPETTKSSLAHARPLLGIAKARLVKTCQARSLAYVEDPANTDGRNGRAHVRRLLVDLAGEGLTAERLNRLASRAARADEALESAASVVLAGTAVMVENSIVSVDWRQVSPAPAELRLRVLRRLLTMRGEDTTPLRLERVEALLAAIDMASSRGGRLRRSIADRLITLHRHGLLTITPASPRRRGMVLDP